MKQNETFIEHLVTETSHYLEKIGYTESRIKQYHAAWNRLRIFMTECGEINYTASIGETFIYKIIGDGTYNDLSQWEKQIISCTNVLTEYLETKTVKFRRCKKFRELNGPIGVTMLEYIRYRKGYGITSGTEDEYKYHLGQFIVYLDEQKIGSVDSISKTSIIDYANSMGFASQNTRHRNLSILRGYLYYLYENNYIESDLSGNVPKCKRTRQPKLPSTYTKDEIEKMLGVIDRSSPKGKRDYAMVLITARLGLRAADVCNLRFSNLLWEENLIVLNQNKTDKIIKLPLLIKIGEAIIDYLRYGRPESELPFVFLHIVSPYDRLNRSTLHSIVCLYMRRAGIKFENNRKCGPHALRHSLAGILLEKKTPIPVISEVLGHCSTESTRLYLRIDVNTLRQCALEVPPIDTLFYGGRSNS